MTRFTCLAAFVVVAAMALPAGAESPRAEEPVRVYAAASLTPVLTQLAGDWQRQGHPAPVLVFAGTPTLAKQLTAGAPADVFVAADQAWMDYVEQRGRIQSGTRADLLGNSLVMVAPRGRGFPVELRRDAPWVRSFTGRLCLGEPDSVPAGVYARQSFESLGLWAALAPRVVGTEDVRAALAFVERGECAAGVVYATDAAGSERIEVLARLPADSHAPIRYPAALLAGAGPQGAAFLEFLRRSPVARQAFERHGFTVLAEAR